MYQLYVNIVTRIVSYRISNDSPMIYSSVDGWPTSAARQTSPNRACMILLSNNQVLPLIKAFGHTCHRWVRGEQQSRHVLHSRGVAFRGNFPLCSVLHFLFVIVGRFSSCIDCGYIRFSCALCRVFNLEVDFYNSRLECLVKRFRRLLDVH